MSSFDDLPKMKRDLEDIEREAAKAAGAEEEWIRRLKKEFGLKTLAEALQKLSDIGERERQTDSVYGKKHKRFRRRYKRYLRRIRDDDDD